MLSLSLSIMDDVWWNKCVDPTNASVAFKVQPSWSGSHRRIPHATHACHRALINFTKNNNINEYLVCKKNHIYVNPL